VFSFGEACSGGKHGRVGSLRDFGQSTRYLGAGLLENRVDRHVSERGAWDQIRDEGWELVAGAADPESGQLVHYFKRPRQEK